MDNASVSLAVLAVLVGACAWVLWALRQARALGAELAQVRQEGEALGRQLVGVEARLSAAQERVQGLEGERDLLAEEARAQRTEADAFRERTALELAQARDTAGELKQALEGRRAELEGRMRELDSTNEAAQRQREALEAQGSKNVALRDELSALQADRAADKQRIEELSQRDRELGRARERIDGLLEEAKRSAETIRELETKLEEQARSFDERLLMEQDHHARQKQAFEGIAAKVLEHNTEKFTGAAQERLGQVTEAFSKAMAELKKKVDEAHGADVRDRVALKTELSRMIEASQQLDAEAKNLTRALTGDRRAQGAWGELTLDTLLEQCGLREGHEYEKQGSYRNGDDRMLRPDVIVHLPGDRSVVVDSKVSLTAYAQYVNAESDADADVALSRHVSSVQAHIKNLASKDYWRLNGLETGDYVLMFLPIEPAFADALRASPGLFEEAFKQNVILTSPCTLLATLRTIEHTWRVERQNETARAIVERAGALYDKFVGFSGDLLKVGERLGQAQREYEGALGKLSAGRGSLVRQAEQLRELGVKVKKALPAELTLSDALPALEQDSPWA